MKISQFKPNKKDPKIYCLGLILLNTIILWIHGLIPLPVDVFDQYAWLTFANQLAVLRWLSIFGLVILVFCSLKWLYKLISIAAVLLIVVVALVNNPYLFLLIYAPYTTAQKAFSYPTVVQKLFSPDHQQEAILYKVPDLTSQLSAGPHLYVVSVQPPNAPRHIIYQSHFEMQGAEYDKLDSCTFSPEINWINNQTIRINQPDTKLFQYVPNHVTGGFSFPISYDDCVRGKRLLRTTFNVYEPTQTFCCI